MLFISFQQTARLPKRLDFTPVELSRKFVLFFPKTETNEGVNAVKGLRLQCARVVIVRDASN